MRLFMARWIGYQVFPSLGHILPYRDKQGMGECNRAISQKNGPDHNSGSWL